MCTERRRTADEYGIDSEIIPTEHSPVVYGEKIVDDSSPTVLFYGHYDVQPPGDRERWDSPPFDPTVRDCADCGTSIFARGSGDNKGQLVAHIFALEILHQVADEQNVNVKYVFEGEEENGSTGFHDFLRTHAEKLECDFVYISDGPMHGSRRPTIVYGNRGLLAMEATITKANTDVHSGNFGGPIPNAANDLVAALDTLFDGTHGTLDVLDEDIDLPDTYAEMASTVPVDHEATKSELGLSRLARSEDQTYYERIALSPTFSINGLTSGYQGDRMKTIIPHEATAKFDIRLLPGQNPDKVFTHVEERLTALDPEISVRKLSTFLPMITDPETPYAELIRDAATTTWNEEAVEMPVLGGSLPAGYLKDVLEVPVLVVPYGNPDQNNHAPNEHMSLDNFKNGIETSARVLANLQRQ
ncbi:M20/M25/M40 family metallo-hydrolase [Haloplanus sp. GCM10025708]|uniref:M20/M25/M40 family metallo-hydrolase n=1 Tax=Haloplanus sp. GCM10025708 TaxID=3252679 RepID=UPI0036094C80